MRGPTSFSHGHVHDHTPLKDHNMWDYLYFTIYLENTTVAQRNHHEIYLYQEFIEKQSIKPFPVLRAMVLKEDVDEAEKAIQNLTQTCSDLQEKTVEMNHKLNLLQQTVANNITDESSNHTSTTSPVRATATSPDLGEDDEMAI
jgi:hypothetical protein